MTVSVGGTCRPVRNTMMSWIDSSNAIRATSTTDTPSDRVAKGLEDGDEFDLE
jgi:hypothetical protein